MASGPLTDLEKFRSWVKPLLYAYPSVDARMLAYVKGGTVYNLFTKLVVSPSPFLHRGPREVGAHPAFVIAREVLPITDVLPLLDSLKDERIRLFGRTVELATPPRDAAASAATKSPLWWHSTQDFADAQFWDGQAPSSNPVKTYVLNTHSGEGSALVSREEFEALHTGLLRSRPRWLGFPDLVKRFLGYRYSFTMDHNTNFSLELPVGCRLGTPWFDSPGWLHVPISAPSLVLPRDLRLSVLLTRPGGATSTREAAVKGPRAPNRSGMGEYVANLSTKGASGAILHLLLHHRIVDKNAYELWDAKSPNPRMAALRAVGQASQELEAVLTDPEGKKRNAETFEIAVSNLFATCGFTTLTPGRRHAEAGEAVDIVAIHPLAPIVFCIECTWKVANSQGKLAKLHQRALDLAKAMPDSTVRPVLIMSKEDATTVETAEASARGVILLTRRNLQALRLKAEWNEGPSAVAQWLTGGQQLKRPG